MDETSFRLPPSYEPVPPPPPWWKRLFAPLAGVLAVCAKFFASLKFLILPVLKFFPLLLKTGGSMILMMWIYATIYGWQYAVGFVLLILAHESGHMIAARGCGLKVSTPMFIPFMGAYVALKEAPPNAWIEAIVAIGGPVAGTVGAVVCHAVFTVTQNPLWLALAYSGYFLNLFNLIPAGIMDGGKIVNAISPWLLLPGLVLLGWFMLEHGPNFILILILVSALPRVWRLFWSRTPEEHLYHDLPASQRITMGICYFGLAGFLFYQMQHVLVELQSFHKLS